ncbi:unnamed protein product [Rhodiola kirilowii]
MDLGVGMTETLFLVLLLPSFLLLLQAKDLSNYRLSKPLIGEEGRVYACSERNLFAFENNGSIAWSVPLNYTCDVTKAPIPGPTPKIYLVADNRVLKIDISKGRDSKYAAQLFFDHDGSVEIIGLTVSIPSSSVFISLKNRGLFAYTLHGQMIWSVGPKLFRSGYRQGCKKNVSNCYFTSVPVVDHCEACVYISNTEGELYSISSRSPYFKWIQDLSSFDTNFMITPGNNGRLYVTIPVRALVLALDVTTGNVLWQRSIGPLNSFDCQPVVDSNGWISVGSLDGYLYSFSANGVLRKFSKAPLLTSVIQVSPLLDCSGTGVYISQTEVEGKISRTLGNYTYVSALKTRNAFFSLLVPAEGSISWSESYHGQFASLFSESDLHHFVVDERILLSLVSASNTGNPRQCRSTSQKLASSCSSKHPKHLSVFVGNERVVLFFLFLETILVIALAGLVRFCCNFWEKKKIQGQSLGTFLEKRRSLRQKRKAFDRTISELQQKATDEAAANTEVLEKISDLVRVREGLQRKLSTAYSLGRDATGSNSNSKSSILPLYNGNTKSYSFQGSRKESVTIFHTLSDTSISSGESSGYLMEMKRKGKAPIVAETSSSGDVSKGYEISPATTSSSSSGGFTNPSLSDTQQGSSAAAWLKRRRPQSSD